MLRCQTLEEEALSLQTSQSAFQARAQENEQRVKELEEEMTRATERWSERLAAREKELGEELHRARAAWEEEAHLLKKDTEEAVVKARHEATLAYERTLATALRDTETKERLMAQQLEATRAEQEGWKRTCEEALEKLKEEQKRAARLKEEGARAIHQALETERRKMQAIQREDKENRVMSDEDWAARLAGVETFWMEKVKAEREATQQRVEELWNARFEEMTLETEIQARLFSEEAEVRIQAVEENYRNELTESLKQQAESLRKEMDQDFSEKEESLLHRIKEAEDVVREEESATLRQKEVRNKSTAVLYQVRRREI